MSRGSRGERGSVLLPVVVAMLVLGVAGAALAELLSAQRMASVGVVASREARWAGEAGLWYAAVLGIAIPGGAPFAGSTVAVEKLGIQYTATAVHDGITQVLSGDLSGQPDLISFGDPLDEVASAATVWQHSDDHFHLALVSHHQDDAVISSISVASTKLLMSFVSFKLGGVDLWHAGAPVLMPTVALPTSRGTTAQRTVRSAETPDAMIGFSSPLGLGTVTFALVLTFTNGTSSIIPVTVSW